MMSQPEPDTAALTANSVIAHHRRPFYVNLLSSLVQL
jgi:hypothetical protein